MGAVEGNEWLIIIENVCSSTHIASVLGACAIVTPPPIHESPIILIIGVLGVIGVQLLEKG